MNRPKLIKCKRDECSEMIVAGDFCWQHRQYNKAIIANYATRSAPNKQMTNTIRSKPILDIDKTNSKETLVNS